MDWTKAKNILIIALVLTNLVLIYSYIFQGSDGETREEAALIAHLKNKNIYIDTDIPEKSNRMPVLTVEHDKVNQTVIDNELEKEKNKKPVPRGKITKYYINSSANRFLTNCDLMEGSVELDSVALNGEDGVVSYKNKVGDYYLANCYMRCIFKNGQIVDFERFWMKAIDFGVSKQTIMPASAALLEFANNNKQKSEEGVIFHITGIKIAYWLDSTAFETETAVSDTALPAWEITFNENEVSYISAFE